MKNRMHFQGGIEELTLHQFHTLIYLKHHHNAQMSEIALYFNITLPTTTNLVDKLIAFKLVRREDDPNDRRIVRIALTKKGLELLQKAMERRNQHMSKVLSFLSPTDKKELVRIMKNLVTNMEIHKK